MNKAEVRDINNEILFSHKKNEIMPFAERRMDLEMIILSKASQRKASVI